VEPQFYSLYSLIALTFVKNIKWNNVHADESSILVRISVVSERYSINKTKYDTSTIKRAIIDCYPLFENVEIKSYSDLATEYIIKDIGDTTEYKDIYVSLKPKMLKIYTNENFYTNPMSVLCNKDADTEISSQYDNDLYSSRVPGLPSCTISG
jgi:hypothetical protein